MEYNIELAFETNRGDLSQFGGACKGHEQWRDRQNVLYLGDRDGHKVFPAGKLHSVERNGLFGIVVKVEGVEAGESIAVFTFSGKTQEFVKVRRGYRCFVPARSVHSFGVWVLVHSHDRSFELYQVQSGQSKDTVMHRMWHAQDRERHFRWSVDLVESFPSFTALSRYRFLTPQLGASVRSVAKKRWQG